MVFHSILYQKAEGSGGWESPDPPPCLSDLNLDQVVDAITADKREYNLKPFFYALLDDIDEIRYRQEVMQDLEDKALLDSIRAFASQMVVVRRYLALSEELDFKNHREGWFLEAAIA